MKGGMIIESNIDKTKIIITLNVKNYSPFLTVEDNTIIQKSIELLKDNIIIFRHFNI
jgi:hypothetical protein